MAWKKVRLNRVVNSRKKKKTTRALKSPEKCMKVLSSLVMAVMYELSIIFKCMATGEHNSQQKGNLVQENAKNEQQTHTANNWKDRAKIC